MSLFFRIVQKINYYRKRKLFKSIGEGAVFFGDIKLINPQYISLGDNCKIGPGCRIEAWDQYAGKKYSPKIEIGKDVRINSNCHIGAINYVNIGNECLFGSNVMITDHAHGNSSFEQASIHPSERELYSKGGVKIGPRCWICENVVILPNVSIGESCIIGANSVVTKDMPSFCVAAGNPARVVKQIKE